MKVHIQADSPSILHIRFFTTQDMAIKFISGNYALHQIIFIRASVAILFTLLVFIPIDGGYKYLLSKQLGLHLLRGFGIVVANLCLLEGVLWDC